MSNETTDLRERVRQAVEWGIEDAWPRYNRIYDPHDPDDESRQEWVGCITEQVVTALLRTPSGEGETEGDRALWSDVDVWLSALERMLYTEEGDSPDYRAVVSLRDRVRMKLRATHPTDRSESDE